MSALAHDGASAGGKKRALPPVYLLTAIASMTALHFLTPVTRVVPWPWSILGVLPLAAGIALNVLADAAFKEHATTVKPFQESSFLVTTGVFRVCRHPMYLGFTLILLGLAIAMGSATPFGVVPIFVALMEVVFIRTEERMLDARFGAAWRAYKVSVRRWL